MTLCIHYGRCGGCSLQHLTPEAYAAHKRQAVVDALAHAGLGQVQVEAPVLVPEYSRRRAVFKLAKAKGAVAVGFHAARSHTIVDMRECLVLSPSLLALAARLRQAMAEILKDGEKAEVHVTQADNGLDLAFRWERKLTPALTAAMARAFAGSDVIRVVLNRELVLETASPILTIGGVAVGLPQHAFLQASQAGEAALTARVTALMKGARHVLDLFAGLGTFTLPLARSSKVHAVEQDAAHLAALASAARTAPGIKPVTTEQRDLFKRPLSGAELKPYDAVLLDPPRAGAAAQTAALAASSLSRIAYVSCDAASFARDAAQLVGAGFAPGPVTPIDQFLYSGHIELVAGFERGRRK